MSCNSDLGSDTDDRLQITLLVSHRWWKKCLLMKTRMILRVMMNSRCEYFNYCQSIVYSMALLQAFIFQTARYLTDMIESGSICMTTLLVVCILWSRKITCKCL
jgi:hypothetical protein